MSEQEHTPFSEWAILEVMGYKRRAGLLSEQIIAGSCFLRLDVYEQEGGPIATQFYRPDAVYCITPVPQDLARRLGSQLFKLDPPVRPYELPAHEDDDE